MGDGRFGHMTNNHWAVYALRDIQNALTRENYPDASSHIDDAIKAIQTSAGDGTLPDTDQGPEVRRQS